MTNLSADRKRNIENQNEKPISETIGEDIRSIFAEMSLNDLYAMMTEPSLEAQQKLEAPNETELTEALSILKESSKEPQAFILALDTLKNSHPDIYAFLMQNSFEFIGMIDKLQNVWGDIAHGLDVMCWKMERMSDRNLRRIVQIEEDLNQS